MTVPAPVVVYIAGYGRSGSTLLDVLLGAHSDLAGLGEAGLLGTQFADETAECGGGESLRRCPQWGPVLENLIADFDLEVVERESRRHERWLYGGPRATAVGQDDYGRAMARFFELHARQKGARMVVDSSKTSYRFFWRPLALQRLAGLDVRVLHLVRDPQAVLASCLKGQNSRLAVGDSRVRPFATPIAIVGWIVANLGARLNAQRLGPGKYLLVEYEHLAAHPQDALARIGAFLGVDMSDLGRRVQAGEAFATGHLMAGNRMARSGTVVAHTGTPPSTHVGFWRRLACTCATSWLYASIRRRGNAPATAL
jgi:hypothetical protein